MAAGHTDPVDAQQGAVEDHERLALRDFDRLTQGGRHGREQVEGLADMAIDRRGADVEAAGQIGVGLTRAQVRHDEQGLPSGRGVARTRHERQAQPAQGPLRRRGPFPRRQGGPAETRPGRLRRGGHRPARHPAEGAGLRARADGAGDRAVADAGVGAAAGPRPVALRRGAARAPGTPGGRPGRPVPQPRGHRRPRHHRRLRRRRRRQPGRHRPQPAGPAAGAGDGAHRQHERVEGGRGRRGDPRGAAAAAHRTRPAVRAGARGWLAAAVRCGAVE